MKKPDTTMDVLWRLVGRSRRPGSSARPNVARYRGVLLVAAVPIILILVIILVVPRTSPLHVERPHTLTELRHKGPRYSVVFDAGSTGSRVHVFLFEPSVTGDLRLVKDTFEQLKPGLSSYPDDPAAAAASLQPLLDIALSTVPKSLQSTTPIILKATAGLRLLPGSKADNILAAVTTLLRATPFMLPKHAVGILDGKDEGGFAWLTLNYLLGKLDSATDDTVAAIDLGGGSVQEAFSVHETVAKKAPDGYVSVMRGGGKTYHVYVHSYLGYGLMAGRAKLAAAASDTRSCFPKGYSGVYKYAGEDIPIRASGGASFEACTALTLDVLEGKKPCGAPQIECSFNGAWKGAAPLKPRVYYVSSYFWDRALETSIIEDKTARIWSMSPAEFREAANGVCKADLKQLATQFTAVKEADQPYLCLDLSYAYTLLTQGFQLKHDEKLTLVKQVDYHGQHIEAAWPLGAAINGMDT